MITSELLEAYLACPMKCYLQSNGEKCSEKQVCRFAPDRNGLVPSCRQLFPLMPAASIALTNAAEKGDPRSYRERERNGTKNVRWRFQTGHQLDTAEAQASKYLKSWRSLGESNSCFRRERATS